MLTREKVFEKWDSMTPRERNEFVCEMIFGYHKEPCGEWFDWIRRDESGEVEDWQTPLFSPSTNQYDALQVVERMKQKGWGVTITAWGDEEDVTPYEVVFGFQGGPYRAEGEFAEAVCKAALLAVMDGEDEHEVELLRMADDTVKLYAAQRIEELEEALREIDTHIRSTQEPIRYIVETLKRVLPEYRKGGGGN